MILFFKIEIHPNPYVIEGFIYMNKVMRYEFYIDINRTKMKSTPIG